MHQWLYHVVACGPPGWPSVRLAARLCVQEGAGEDTGMQPLPTRHRSHCPLVKALKALLRGLQCEVCNVRPAPRLAQPRTRAGLT
jgi:hypothetical protein